MKTWMTLSLTGVVAWSAGCGTFKGKPAASAPDANSATSPAVESPKPAVRYVRRPHLQFKNEQDLGAYMTLAAGKSTCRENTRVLTRRLQQKALDLKGIKDTLEKEFQYVSGNRYDYDAQTRVLANVEEDGKGGIVKKKVATLTPESEKKFTALLENRKRLLDEASAIHAGLMRAQNELAEFQARLLKEYAVSRDREYEVDQKSRMLTEKIAVPARFEVEGE